MPEIEMPDPEDLGGNVTKPFKFVTAGYDARFPNQNQYVDLENEETWNTLFDPEIRTKHCWQNYVDYHKCVLAKGEEFKPCRQFYLAYRSLCPNAWVQRWNDQREAGNFPVDLEH